VAGSGGDHRCRHLRSWPDCVRGGWVESFRGRVGGDYERFGGGLGRHARGVADVRAHGYTRVIPDANDLADTHAFRGR
jgi:hypothetical protein